MKLLSFLTLVLFSTFSMAGSVGTGSFETFTNSQTYTEVEGVSSSSEVGSGSIGMQDGLNFRGEEYTRNDSSVTEFDGESNTSRFTMTQGSNNGLSGHSLSNSESYTEGYTDSVQYIDNSIAGTYEELSFNTGSISYESGDFSRDYEATQTSYQDYETETYSENSDTYSAW